MGPDTYKAWLYRGGGKARLEKLRAGQGLKTMIVGIGSPEISVGLLILIPGLRAPPWPGGCPGCLSRF